MNKNLLLLFLCFILSFQVKLNAQTDTIYVNINATGTNSGTSWVNAYNYFGDALKTSKYGDEIWVAKGTYSAKEADPFEIDKSIKIYGGFKGDELSIEQRDWKVNETILDKSQLLGFNYRTNILYISNTDTTNVIDGFIIQNGFASIPGPSDPPGPADTITCENNPYNYRACLGGGIFMQSTSTDKPVFLNVINCLFRNNRAIKGGAIGIESYNGMGGIVINQCEFDKNKAEEEGGGVYLSLGAQSKFTTKIENSKFKENGAYFSSGAISCSAYSIDAILIINNIKFINNKTTLYGIGGLGVYSSNRKGTVIRDCLFMDNSGGWKGSRSGALNTINSNVINCRFTNNQAWEGGAVTGYSNTFLNCIFDHNFCINSGGAIQIDGFKNQDSTIFVNCIFHKNESGNIGGAIYNYFNQKFKVYNSIFSENKALISGSTILTIYADKYPEINLSNNMFDEANLDSIVIIQNAYNNLNDSSNINIAIDTSTIILDSPIYWDTAIGDYRISNCSKAIDAGDAKWTKQYGLNIDYTNGPRIKDKNPDLGAYEMDKFLSFDTLISNATTTQTQDGSITLLNIKGFKPPLNYTWSTGSKDPSISMLQAGTYGVFIEDSLHCSEAFYFKVEALTSVNTINSLSEISIIPNTVNRFGTKPVLSINSNINQELTFLITNNNGIVISKEHLNIVSGVNTKELSNNIPGVYYMVLENKENQKAVLKYIVN